MAVCAVFRAWVFSMLWGWFVVPLFSVPELSLAMAYGIALTAGYVRMKAGESKPDQNIKDIIIKGISDVVGKGLVFLLCGWIASLFI